jgi:hypothetical protein
VVTVLSTDHAVRSPSLGVEAIAMGEKGDSSQATGGLGERMVRQSGDPTPAAPAGGGGSGGWGLSDITDAVHDRVTDAAGGGVAGLRGEKDDNDKSEG